MWRTLWAIRNFKDIRKKIKNLHLKSSDVQLAQHLKVQRLENELQLSFGQITFISF